MLIVKMQFGSHVYGTNTPTSDFDLKSIYVPKAREILLESVTESIHETTKQDKSAKNTAVDTDHESFSFHKYIKLLCEGQTVALDMLFTPAKFYTEEPGLAWHLIQANKHKFISKKSASFVGYCRTQANKYGIKGSRMAAIRNVLTVLQACPTPHNTTKLKDHWGEITDAIKDQEHSSTEFIKGPNGKEMLHLVVCNRKIPDHATFKYAIEIFQRIFDEYGERAKLAEKNEGIDWKALMHAVRVAKEAQELLQTGHITQPRPERELLLKIRKGELPYKQVAEIIEQGLVDVEQCELESPLQEEPDRNFAQGLVLAVYGNAVSHFISNAWGEF